MDIIFSTNRQKKLFNSIQKLERNQGADRARKIRRHMDRFRAADSLEEFRNLPGRCHELSANRKGQLSLDLDGPYRLIFEPAYNPFPVNNFGGLDWKAVRAVKIIEIVDYHD